MAATRTILGLTAFAAGLLAAAAIFVVIASAKPGAPGPVAMLVIGTAACLLVMCAYWKSGLRSQDTDDLVTARELRERVRLPLILAATALAPFMLRGNGTGAAFAVLFLAGVLVGFALMIGINLTVPTRRMALLARFVTRSAARSVSSSRR